ncbi:hypothetical protein GCM10011583_31600 [Streptomyces camponoticapitis]|uniref:Uncharacterized protein n=1 Tax=Streptomyces camponoticapitis TaxID=1616125 RepID=A0ABQ2E6Y8_9ACTN|nr:hypothetical protein [Streptomyces camponoticapitis]GGJ97793.1 hypothetical protein GCM10011583_31600 [Streptomyces camponoticapitis]
MSAEYRGWDIHGCPFAADSPYELPRVLLIDEFDKSDTDLPNDLPNVLKEERP